jgi:general secretion pathway protein K
LKPDRERGYAMIAAIIGVAAFAFIAFEFMAQDRGVLAEVRGEAEQAQLTADCNAGLYLAIYNLSSNDVTQRWGIDGRSRTVQLGRSTLVITVEDERGKIPLNGIIQEEVHDTFAAAGATGTQLSILTNAFEDWQDSDNSARPNGAEAPAYASLGYKPRNAGFRTVGELRMLRGMTDDIYYRLAPATTVFFGESGGFSESTAQPLALQVLGEVAANSPEVIERQRELSGQAAMPQTLTKVNLIGRTLTVRVEAHRGATYLKRTAIVELAGPRASDYFWIRTLD